MKGWNELGVVDTIYEEEYQEEEYQEEEEEEEECNNNNNKSFSLTTPSLTTSPVSPHYSSSLLSPPPHYSLHSTVEKWSMVRGCKTDVVIRMHDRYFNLHKEPLISRSHYLRRRLLTESTDITVTPPSNLTAETFTEIFLFCYDSGINLTPSNLAAVRVAAEWLEMDFDRSGGGRELDGSLMWRTEIYFRQEIAGDKENARQALGACAVLLPDETAALLAVRCLDVVEREGGDGGWMEELTALGVEEFRAIAEAMRTWFAHDHDLLYRLVDHYLQKHIGKMSEDDKVRICSTISSTNLSHHLLLHLVQNPSLPLRFVVQSILLHHLHYHSRSRDSFIHLQPLPQPTTLGSILHRDATLRQSSHIRASMRATAFRIDSLEHDLEGLRRKLRWSEEKTAEMEEVRASSFRIVRQNQNEEEVEEIGRSCKSGKGIGRKMVDGLKSVFRTSPTTKMNKVGDERKVAGHRRNNSFA